MSNNYVYTSLMNTHNLILCDQVIKLSTKWNKMSTAGNKISLGTKCHIRTFRTVLRFFVSRLIILKKEQNIGTKCLIN